MTMLQDIKAAQRLAVWYRYVPLPRLFDLTYSYALALRM